MTFPRHEAGQTKFRIHLMAAGQEPTPSTSSLQDGRSKRVLEAEEFASVRPATICGVSAGSDDPGECDRV